MSKNTQLGNLVNGIYVDSTGKVGVGMQSPTVPLDVTGAGKFSTTVTAQTGLKLPANGNGTSPTLAYNNSLGFGVSGTGIFFGNLYNSDLSTAMQLRVTNSGGTDITAMTINSTGNVGIGITNPGELLTLGKAGGGQVFQAKDNTTNYSIGYIQFNTDNMTLNPEGGASGTSGYFRFITANTERMRITSGGNVGIGTTADTSKLTITASNFPALRINADAGYNALSIGGTGLIRVDYPGIGGGRFEINDSGTMFLRLYSNGTLSISSGQVVSSSDINLKIDDGSIENALDKILRLNPRYFYWKEDSGIETNERQLGFYAQNVQEALGEEVANNNNNNKWGIYDRGIVAMLTKAIQELSAEINILKNK